MRDKASIKTGRINVRLPGALAAAVDKAAAAEYLSPSEYVRKVLAAAVKR
jgi:predicted HicB family RNase H-like nuclease